MKTVIFDVKKETVADAVEQIQKKHDDSVTILAPFVGSMSTHAPTKTGKTKGYHRLKLEVWIPEDAIKGEDALTEFVSFAVLQLPKSRVQDHLINPETKKDVWIVVNTVFFEGGSEIYGHRVKNEVNNARVIISLATADKLRSEGRLKVAEYQELSFCSVGRDFQESDKFL